VAGEAGRRAAACRCPRGKQLEPLAAAAGDQHQQACASSVGVVKGFNFCLDNLRAGPLKNRILILFNFKLKNLKIK